MNFVVATDGWRHGGERSDFRHRNLDMSLIAVTEDAVTSAVALDIQVDRNIRQVDPRVGRASSGRALVVSAGPPRPLRFQRRQLRIARAPFCQPHQPTHAVACKEAPSLLAKLPTVYGR